MDTTDNVYVAELLQQLEELKRKKARRLQKLKKLKKTTGHNQSAAKDISCSSLQNVSQIVDSKQDDSPSKCAKCGLCLISKDAACIQCISTEHKENWKKEPTKSDIAAESVVSGDQAIIDPETSTMGLKHKNFKEISNLNFIGEVQKGSSSCVSESTLSKIIAGDSKEMLNLESSRKQRKRSSVAENDLEEGDHKKLKLSEKDVKNSISDISVGTNNNAYEKYVSSVFGKKELKEKSESKSLNKGIDETFFSDMSCFLPSSLIEEEDKIKVDTTKPEQVTKVCHTKESSEDSVKDPTNFMVSKKAAETADSESFENTKLEDCKMGGHFQKFEALSNDPLLKCKTIFSNTDVENQPEVIPDTMVEDTLAENSSVQGNLMVVKDSIQEPVLGEKLDCEFSTKKLLSPHENVKKFGKESENDFNSISADDDPNAKVNDDICEDILTDSQLVKDLKNSDFSSFENSDSPEKVSDTMETPNLFIPNNYSLEPKPEIVELNGSCHNNQLKSLDKEEELEDNGNSSLIENCDKKIKSLVNDNVFDEVDMNCIPETSAINGDKVQLNVDESEALYDDAMTADIDFESSTSLEVADTLEDLLSNGSVPNFTKPASVSNEHTSIDVLELNPPETEIFTIPETVLLDIKPEIINNKHNSEERIAHRISNNKCDSEVKVDRRNELKPIMLEKDVSIENNTKSLVPNKDHQSVDAYYKEDNYFEETQCDSLDQLQTIQDTVFLNAEDSLALGICRDFPFMEKEAKKKSLAETEDISVEDQAETISFLCSLHGHIDEPVNDIQLVTFNKSSYVFIQHLTWIQVWKQEESRNWSKIFSHQVDDKLQLKEICFTKDSKHLILIMLLQGEGVHCLQFLLFESEARVIKLMEHTHWMNSKCPEETVLLCGLEDLKFATAQGKDHFEVFVHVFSALDDHPRLAMVTLGSTPGRLHSLCRIEKLPNALMGTSHSTLYVWHLLEARLVTSVLLQLPEQISIEKCIWATIESGLVFLMTVCKGKGDFQSCQLLAANLATGFCQTAMSYSSMPAKELQYVKNKNLKAIYNEPFLALSSEDGCFLWSVSEEYCLAALGSKSRMAAVNIGNDKDEKLIVAAGNDSGCVNCYSLKCP